MAERIKVNSVGEPVLTSRLVFKPNYSKFDEKYDFYRITTSEKFIRRGARCLDDPQNVLKAWSFSYESGRIAFLMFQKDAVTQSQIVEVLRKDAKGNYDPESEKLTVEHILCQEIKDYLLIRLLVNSIINYPNSRHRFNNLSGKVMFLLKKQRTSPQLVALEVGPDWKFNLNVAAAGLDPVIRKNGDGYRKKYLGDYPPYVLGGNKETLRRAGPDDKETDWFIRKVDGDKKARYPFYVMPTKNEEMNKDCKVYYLYEMLDYLNEQYGEELWEPISFATKTVSREITERKCSDRKMEERIHNRFRNGIGWPIHIVNLLGEESEVAKKMVEQMKGYFQRHGLEDVDKRMTEGSRCIHDAMNIVLLHSPAYYANNHIKDPHQELPYLDYVIQCVTDDNFGDIDKEKAFDAAFFTILKELIIKQDIVHEKAITLSDWSEDTQAKGDWIFGAEENGKYYFMKIASNGRLFFYDCYPFSEGEAEFEAQIKALNEAKEPTKTIIQTPEGDMCIISKTGGFIMPAREALSLKTKRKEVKIPALRGVFNIHCYDEGDIVYYSAGRDDASLQFDLENATLLYQCKTISGRQLLPELLETFAVSFVKLNSYTVMPYPFKYLREWISMYLTIHPEKKEKKAKKE